MLRFHFAFFCLSAMSMVAIVGCAEPDPSESAMPLTADDIRDAVGGGDSMPVDASPSKPGAVDADAPEEFQETASGLRYRIRRASEGAMPTAADTVTVHYRGWLDDGKEFDSSYERSMPATFGLGGVIKGWTEGLQLIGVGGMLELEIPSELGYGPRGQGGTIPPDATLHFIVELLKIE